MTVTVTALDLLARATLTLVEARPATFELRLDGWRLLRVDLGRGTVGVNDLRAHHLFSHHVCVPASRGGPVRVGAVGDELYVLAGSAVAVFVVPDATSGTHAEVRVVDACTGRLLGDLAVRYRQFEVASASGAAGRE